MTNPMFNHNRVILCHFDSYSAALVFARYGSSILAPLPLPESAAAVPAPGDVTEQHSTSLVLDALVTHFGIAPAKLNLDERFQAWMTSTETHKYRNMKRQIFPHGGVARRCI